MNPSKRTPPAPAFSAFQPFQPATSHLGTIVEWLDGKGYGWVKSGDKRYFAHIKDFEAGQRRPRTGEEVLFIQGIDAKGRMCAKSVRFPEVSGRVEFGIWLFLAGLLALPLLALLRLPFPWWQGAGGMIIASAITYGMYAHDKGQARSGYWRISEGALHLAELFGGWPGALLAQRSLRHKCSKGSYQVVFWGIVMLFQLAALDLILDHALSRALLVFIK